MIKFEKPVNLNGAELLNQLSSAGIAITNKPFVDGHGDLWLDIANKDEAKAKPIVAAHNGTTVAPEPTVEQKLASVGLNLEDLKAALGL
jgi:hypothetical protein